MKMHPPESVPAPILPDLYVPPEKRGFGPPRGEEAPPPRELPAAGNRVLCVPRHAFDAAGGGQGFLPEPAFTRLRDALLVPGLAEYRPRAEAEEDPAWKQVIPYALARRGSRLYGYRRGKSGGEARLHAKWSLGIGGHVDECDAFNPAWDEARRAIASDPRTWVAAALDREIVEEVGRMPATCRALGVVNDDSDPVGRVHLGFVSYLDYPGPIAGPRSRDLEAWRIQTPAQWDDYPLESWSRLILDHLLGRRP